jgi:uncharacterized protein (TIGR02466 family)
MIEHWFTTPLYATDLSGDILTQVQDEIHSALPRIRKVCTKSLYNESVSTTFGFNERLTDDIETFQLENFKQVIHAARDDYVKQLNYHGDPFKSGGSWTSFYRRGGLHFDHVHPFSRISGVYYYATNGQDGNIKFLNPNQHIHYGGFPADGVSIDTVSYSPKVGRLILFPAWLTHRVEVNTTDHERISIAFNFN